MVSKSVEYRVGQLEPARVFTVSDLGFPIENWENVRVKLGRMTRQGIIKKVGNGKFYKPEQSVFGAVAPDSYELVKDLLIKDGVVDGYLTGYSVWNEMLLTTQISNTIVIGCNRRREPLTRGFYKVRFVLQPNKITRGNIYLLQILDALKFLKTIPDTNLAESVGRLNDIIAELKATDLDVLIKLAFKYPPRVRALLGAIVENIGMKEKVFGLRKTLNPATTYKIGLQNEKCLNLKDWYII